MSEPKAPFTCKLCGQPSWHDPSDQWMPATTCAESDHGFDYISDLRQEVETKFEKAIESAMAGMADDSLTRMIKNHIITSVALKLADVFPSLSPESAFTLLPALGLSDGKVYKIVEHAANQLLDEIKEDCTHEFYRVTYKLCHDAEGFTGTVADADEMADILLKGVIAKNVPRGTSEGQL